MVVVVYYTIVIVVVVGAVETMENPLAASIDLKNPHGKPVDGYP